MPLGTTRREPSQKQQSATSISMSARLVSPGFKSIFANPLICFAGSPRTFGYATYAWTISDPSRRPVFFTSTETRILSFASADVLSIFALAYSNVV